MGEAGLGGRVRNKAHWRTWELSEAQRGPPDASRPGWAGKGPGAKRTDAPLTTASGLLDEQRQPGHCVCVLLARQPPTRLGRARTASART